MRFPRLRAVVTAAGAAVLAATFMVTAVQSSATASAPVAPAAPAAPVAPAVVGAHTVSAIPGRYLVELRNDPAVRTDGIAARAKALAGTHHGRLDAVFTRSTHGFAVSMSAADATKLAAEPDVATVFQDQRMAAAPPSAAKPAARTQAVTPHATQSKVPSWGLDRIDQHALPLDGNYNYDDTAGKGVTVYILSTGVQTSNPDFAGRVSAGPDFVDGSGSGTDCNGTGSEAAGIIGGTQYGVAKKVNMVSVRMNDCSNTSSLTQFEEAFDWVESNAVKPSVVWDDIFYCVDSNGQPVACDPSFVSQENSVQESLAAAGIPVIVAAGDFAEDKCSASIGVAPDSIYVGATDSNDGLDSISDFGACITMYAPGGAIVTDSPGGNGQVETGTSFAAAYVAGAAALIMSQPQFASATPGQIRAELVKNRSTPNLITGLPGGSNNLLLFTGPDTFFSIDDPASMAPAPNGDVTLYGANPQGVLFQRELAGAGSTSWTGWSSSSTVGWRGVTASSTLDGRVEMIGESLASDVYARAQQTVGDSTKWFDWHRLPLAQHKVAREAAAANSDGRMVVFGVNFSGQLLYQAQTGPNSKTWSGWQNFPSPPTIVGSLTATVDSGGRIRLLVLDYAGQLWQSTQTTAGDPAHWSAFGLVSGIGMASISVTHNSDGTLELVGVDTGDNTWHRTQTAAGADTWTAWSALPPRSIADVAVATDGDGEVHVIGVDNTGAIWQAAKQPGASTYSAWTQIDGVFRP